MVLSVFKGRYFFMRLLLLSAAAALTAVGIMTIYAVGHPCPIQSDPVTGQPLPPIVQPPDNSVDVAIAAFEPSEYESEWKKQLAFAGIGLFCLVLVNLFNYQRIGPFSYFLYGVILVMLALLLVDSVVNLPFVHERYGIRRWFKVGFGFMVQPSEFCKIAYILALAWYLRFRSNYRTFLGLVGPFALTLLAMILILLEPDLGTVLLMMPILFAMLFVAGAQVKHLLLILCMGIAVSPILWNFMHGYQRMRISSVLLQNERIFAFAEKHEKLAEILVGEPEKLREWKRNEGYQLLQAKQAIASGGMSGYGFAKGPYMQSSYLNLPEPHNDMIFATIAHQFGFWGCAGVLLLYAIILGCAIELAWLNTDPFGRLVAVGIAAMFGIQVLVNVSMTLGLMPITGITLPLVSYGGSSLLVNLIAIGLLNNIGKHRPFSVANRPFEFGG